MRPRESDYTGCRWTLRNLEGDVRGPLTRVGDEVEVMPVSEHEEIVASLNQSEPGSAYFTSPAMKRLADEHERLREAALPVVEFVESRPGWQVPLLRALVADLRSVLSPVNPQEDER